MEFWWRPLFLLIGLLVVGWVVGSNWGAEYGWQLVVVGLVVFEIGQLRQLKRLYNWLVQPDSTPPPATTGLWGEVLYLLEKLLKKREKQRKKALNDLEQMREATRSLPDAVVILDRELRIDWFNDAAERLLDLSPQTDRGQFLVYLIRQSQFIEWLQGADPTRPLLLTGQGKASRSLEMRVVRLIRKQKMLIARDVTEEMRVDAMRRDFVANVSHELRSPLTVIAAYLEGFEDMEYVEIGELQKYVPSMRQQSDRMRRLIDDLLTLAKLEGVSELREELVDMPALAERLTREANSLSQGAHDIHLGEVCSAQLKGSSDELYTAFSNLISNAVRYTPAGGRITLKWVLNERGAEFTVCDTGMGIEPQHIPRLTERFYRVDQARSRATGGTGLGLAIVKHILNRHQARLRVESTLGKGSTFAAMFSGERVVLPVTEVAVEVAAEISPDPAPADQPAAP